MPNQSNQTQPTSCPAPKEGSFRTTIGGQALIEGILMRGPEKQAIVVRNQNGGLEVQEQTRTFTKENYPILGIPFLRGIVSFVGSLVVGIKALSWSAEFYPEDEEESKSKFETWVETRFGEKALTNWITGVAMLAGLVFAVALFIILPTLATSALLHFFPDAPMWVRNLLEGVVKLVIFFLYLYLCSKMKDIHRTFQYHGAEHKTIFCYEAGPGPHRRERPRHATAPSPLRHQLSLRGHRRGDLGLLRGLRPAGRPGRRDEPPGAHPAAPGPGARGGGRDL